MRVSGSLARLCAGWSVGMAAAVGVVSWPAHAAATAAADCVAMSGPVCMGPVQWLWDGHPPAIPEWPGSAPAQGEDEVSEDGEAVFNVTRPSLQAYLPAADRATGAAVLVAPGGGFSFLSIQSEGTRVAQWLAEHGIAAYVLRYRTFYRHPGESRESLAKRVFPSVPTGVAGLASVADGREALRVIRAQAARQGIDPHRVGVVGFSAGAHVAGMLALDMPPSVRPDFVGLIYGLPIQPPSAPPLPPANLPDPPGTPKEAWLRPPPQPAPGALPPIFMVMSQDDWAVGNGVRMFYSALFDAGYRPELHLYQRGQHGFGMKVQGTTSDHWIDEFQWWIESNGFTTARR